MANIIYTHSSTLFAQAYGSDVYGCGTYQYQEGCIAGATPTAPNTGMILTDPSFAIPGSLILAILIAVVTTTIAKLIRRKRRA